MQATTVTRNDMVEIVSHKLLASGLNISNPEMIARNLLSHYNYNLEKVLELAV